MKRTLTLTIGVVGMVALVGCGGSNPAGPGSVQEHIFVESSRVASLDERFVGAWRGIDVASAAITFRKGGLVEVSAPAGAGIFGTYKVDEDKLSMVADGEQQAIVVGGLLVRFTTYAYSIEGNVLTLTGPNGERTRWEKQ